MKYKVLFLIFTIFICQEGFTQTNADPMRIYYRSGHRTLDTLYRNNHFTLQRMAHLINKAYRTNELDSIEISSYASPDGSNLMNKRLTQLRADSLATYLIRRTGIPGEMVKTRGGGIGWHILYELVDASDMPYRRNVLHIIAHTPEWIKNRDSVIVDGRKKQLMDLEGGEPYHYMKRHFFPDMRSCTAVSFYLKKGAKTLTDELTEGLDVRESARRTETDNRSDEAVTPESRKSVAEKLEAERREAEQALADQEARRAADENKAAAKAEEKTTEEERQNAWSRLAVKTNLLYDAALMPSLEVEYRINDRWSVNLEGDMAWWKKKSKHKYYQLAIISPEGRYWFKTKAPWHGHYVGVFVGGGWYDLENGKRGYQGEGVMAGVSYGYMFPVTRRLSFEAGIGAGYLRAKYEEYLPEAGGHYLYQQTSKTNYFGPLKLKFALVWRLWDFNQKKGGMQ